MGEVLVDVGSSYRVCIVETAKAFGATTVCGEDVAEIKRRGDANNDWIVRAAPSGLEKVEKRDVSPKF